MRLAKIGEVLQYLCRKTTPFTLGIRSKVADNLSRPKAGSIQYGSREDVEKRIYVDKISAKSSIDTGVTSTVIRFTIKGISKIKNKYFSDLEYSFSTNIKATEPYHKTPIQFDKYVMTQGSKKYRFDGRVEYMMKGSINGKNGIYHITVRDGNKVIHKTFIPADRWEDFGGKYGLPYYDKIK